MAASEFFLWASVRIKRGLEAIGEKLQELSSYEKQDLEKRIVLDYAKEKGLWIDDLYSLGNPSNAGGNENTLAIDQENNIVYKSNNLFNANHTISVLLEQIQLHNKLFPQTKYELVGFTGIDNGVKRVPHIEVILKQDFIKEAEQATPQEIDDYMEAISFQKVDEAKYTNGQYTVYDLYPRNVLKDKRGTIYVVDNIVRKNS